jgi:putative nucleotidyltransferase with HDIG domain
MIQRGTPRSITVSTAAAFGVALAALLVIALFPIFPRQFSVHVNDRASRTVKAPRTVTFESASRTAQKRDEAARAVPPTYVYDPSVRTRQLSTYDATTAQITQIRGEDADFPRKSEALARLQLSQRSIETAIGLSDDRWQGVAAEGRRVLSQVLSGSIDDASVAATKDSIDSQIAPQLIVDEALLAAELVRPLIVSTQVVDAAKTQQAQDAARAAVPPERIVVNKGDTILSANTEVDALAVEKLRAEGLLSNRVEVRNVIAVAIVSAVLAACMAAYLFVLRPRGIDSERHLLALALVIALPLLVAKFYLPLVLPDESRHFLAYMLPVATAPILIAALLETDVAAVVSLVIGALIAFVSAFLPDISLVAAIGPLDSMRLMLVYGVAPLVGVFLVHRADRLNRFLTAGLATGGASCALLVATWLIDGDRTNVDLAWIAFASGMNGAVAGVLAAGVFVTLGVLFGVTTRIQLMELSQLNAPLLRRLQDEAPGTFHHSIIVGNLAERAADLVGADALLTRVGCYYHDIGKVLQPGMYIENIAGAESPHDVMSPAESASVIQQHVLGGIDLARRQRLPTRVQAFIPEHHGTRLVAYFYRKAAEKDPLVDPATYQYPGPKPQSRETAIVMLADSTEAVVRASEDRSPERINQLVDEVIAERVAEGQLDESDLTLRDLRTIAESFKTTMRAVYHPRVQYPEPTPMEARRRVLRLPMRTLGGQRVDLPDPRRRKIE